MSESLKVFISYSHDDEEHKEWVYRLACDLVKNGIETILDQWDLPIGGNLPKFMERGLTHSDRVLVICTENYIDKSNNGIGGVGYEKNILTAELLYSQDSNKFIPIVRNVQHKIKTPLCLAGRLYIDFSNNKTYKTSLRNLLHELHGVPLKPKPKLGKNPFVKENEEIPVLHEDSTVFFDKRFCLAFPGTRGITWIKDSKIATDRLMILFQKPIEFENITPIWWWGDGDDPIKTVEQIGESLVLMNGEELVIDEIATVNMGAYYQKLIYIKIKPSEKTGLYDYSYISDSLDSYGYAREEFAIFNNKFISREEYDDGAAIIDNLPVPLNGQAELRVRFLTPYNFFIAPYNSPINSKKFDRIGRNILIEILKGEVSLEDFVHEFIKLPRREKYEEGF